MCVHDEDWLKVQLVIEEGPPDDGQGAPYEPSPPPSAPTRRYNALGILEDIPAEEPAVGVQSVVDVGPAESPNETPTTARRDPVIVGAGRAPAFDEEASRQDRRRAFGVETLRLDRVPALT